MRKHNRGETAALGPASAELLKMMEKEPGLLSQLGKDVFELLQLPLAAPGQDPACTWLQSGAVLTDTEL